MTQLTDIIIKQIKRSGPITVAEYMTQCLLHPEHGYYTTHQPLGAKGDFVTAPEISQMFGEMIGLCLAQAWIDQGMPKPFTLAEIGPGRGTLMSDILRATKGISGFHETAQVVLVEASPRLQQEQAATLSEYAVTWVPDVTQLPDQALFLIANEFFDCLPIQQFIRTDNGWQEQMVATDNGQLGVMLGAQKPIELYGDAPFRTILEICPSANAIATDIAQMVGSYGGTALLIDYGDWELAGDTLQAVSNHQKVNPLENCGTYDLTAHVNFKALSTAAAPFAQVSGLTDQGALLERLGITGRAQSLATHLQGDALENHIMAHRRLTHPDEMGHLFKAIALTPKGAAHPAGFDT